MRFATDLIYKNSKSKRLAIHPSHCSLRTHTTVYLLYSVRPLNLAYAILSQSRTAQYYLVYGSYATAREIVVTAAELCSAADKSSRPLARLCRVVRILLLQMVLV